MGDGGPNRRQAITSPRRGPGASPDTAHEAIVERFATLPAADRRFLQNWVATHKTVSRALYAAFEKGRALGETNLRIEGLIVKNRRVTFTIIPDNHECRVIVAKRGRPSGVPREVAGERTDEARSPRRSHARMRAPESVASATKRASLFATCSAEDRRFFKQWGATCETVLKALDAAIKKGHALGETNLRLETLFVRNRRITFAVIRCNDEWQVIMAKRGRPSTAALRKEAAAAMKRAKDLLQPVLKSLRKHSSEHLKSQRRSVWTARAKIWAAVAKDNSAVIQRIGDAAWNALIAQTEDDLTTVTLDDLASRLVHHEVPIYGPYTLSKLGRTQSIAEKR